MHILDISSTISLNHINKTFQKKFYIGNKGKAIKYNIDKQQLRHWKNKKIHWSSLLKRLQEQVIHHLTINCFSSIRCTNLFILLHALVQRPKKVYFFHADSVTCMMCLYLRDFENSTSPSLCTFSSTGLN